MRKVYRHDWPTIPHALGVVWDIDQSPVRRVYNPINMALSMDRRRQRGSPNHVQY